MNKISSTRWADWSSANRKSKTCGERRRTIQNHRSLLLTIENPKSKIQNLVAGLFVIVVALTMCGARAEAQQTGKVTRIGFLDGSTASGSAVLVDAFRQEMIKLGWIEGKNIAIEYRFAEQKPKRLPELAADLVRLNVDLIVVSGISAALVAKKATATIPIVMTTAGDPVDSGLVASLARPGGNVTGLSNLATELNSKRLEVLRDAIPKLLRVGFLLGMRASVPGDLQLKELRPRLWH